MQINLFRYQFADGKVIRASNNLGFVHRMRSNSFFPCDTLYDYMKSVSKRGKKIGLNIRFDDQDHFVEDLINGGILTIQTIGTGNN